MRHQYSRMKRNLCIGLLVVLASAPAHCADPSRWSRQISSYTSDISDWVPLPGPVQRAPEQPIKRQAVAQPRILSEPFPAFNRPSEIQEKFQSGPFFQNQGNRPLYLQSVPSAPQNFLTDQGFGQQSIRLALGAPQFPLSQGFVAPSYSFDSTQTRSEVNPRFPQLHQSALPVPLKFEPFQKNNLPPNFPQIRMPPSPAPASLYPTLHMVLPPKWPEKPKFINGYRVENASQEFNFNKRPQSLQKLKLESSPPSAGFNQRNEKVSEIFPTKSTRPATVEKEELQLLYVPVESLNRGFNYKTVPSPQTLNRDLFSSPAVQRPDSINQPFPSNNQRHTNQRPQQGFQTINQEYLNSLNPPKKFGNSNLASLASFGTSHATQFPPIETTPKPKKLKPHQPPLAVFMAHDQKGDNIKVADVLSTLKSARNIAVLDSVSPANSPKVFIGPSSLHAPENYVKFELPYLSNLENTDRKLRQLPFFVAPLSYSTPDGFAKIPFPSPHVGSVIVNALLKETNPNPYITSTPIADVIPNSYTSGTPSYHTEKESQFSNSVTTKPTFSYFSTVTPKTPSTRDPFQSQFFSIEPQGVTSFKPTAVPEKSRDVITNPPRNPPFFPSFSSNLNFHSQNANYQNKVQEYQHSTQTPPEAIHDVHTENINSKLKPENPSSVAPPLNSAPPPSVTRNTTPKGPSTFPSHLLETHNPFSINQAFDFSSPLDYHNIYEENKKDFATSSFDTNTPKVPAPSSELSTEKEIQKPASPNYLQNYSPEIHYQTEIVSSRFPSFDVNRYPVSTDASTENDSPSQPIPTSDFSSDKTIKENTLAPIPEYGQSTSSYDQYSSNRETNNESTAAPSSTTSTTTRRPLRTRGRPRQSTSKPEINETSSRAPVTRKPIRERRPLPSRNRYETSSKPSTERSTSSRRQPDSSSTESSAYKSTRLRTRGRLHYKPTEHPDELYDVNKKSKSKKEEDDIAYQRDVLHQNYPVTLMERMSTVDIEAITSPSPRISSTRFISREPTSESYNTEPPFVSEQPSQYSSFDKSAIKEIEPPVYTSRSVNIPTEITFVPRFSANINEEPSYHSRSSTKRYEEPTFEPRTSSVKYEQSAYVPRSSTSQIIKAETTESLPITTESVRSSSYQYSDFDLNKKDNVNQNKEDNIEISKNHNVVEPSEHNNQNQEQSVQKETHEVNTIPPTTTNYRNKPRNRQFATRQHPASTSTTTESTSTATHKVARVEIKRRPVQPVTYRPALERRRTTMRIEEIESELKTKQVHSRPEGIPESRHPVYKPEPNTEPAPTTYTTQPSKKVSQYKRRRPQSNSSVSSSTETPVVAAKKPTYETKNRLRSRRPSTEKPVAQTVISETTISSITKSPLYNRYNHRARVPESRNNRKPITKEAPEDADEESEPIPESSIHRPKIVPYEEKTEEGNSWSPNLSSNSFKPFNPNDIQEIKFDEKDYVKNTNDSHKEEVDIITVRNDYEDILVSVTPASNRLNKKMPDITPTLEALVEQTKTTATGSDSDTISTIESVIEDMMKSLEEQDEDEYTRNVMKHEGGEIGEIPPERVISSGETVSERHRQSLEQELTTDTSSHQDSPNNNQGNDKDRRGRRRGYWKKVRVRPVTTESFEVAESQFYVNTVNHLGNDEKPSKIVANRKNNISTPVAVASTNILDIKEKGDQTDSTTVMPDTSEIETVTQLKERTTVKAQGVSETTVKEYSKQNEETFSAPTTVDTLNPGDMDLGTGSPDSTVMDMIYEYTTQPYLPKPTSSDQAGISILENSKDLNGVMDYLFGFTVTGENKEENDGTEDYSSTSKNELNLTFNDTKNIEFSTEKSSATEVSSKTTSETAYVPAEITESPMTDEEKETEVLIAEQFESIKKIKVTTEHTPVKELTTTEEIRKENVQTSTESSFWDSAAVVSTSMSTEVSHETEICFRGKCIKTNKDLI